MFFLKLISKLPLWFLYRLADVLFFLMYYFPGYRKKVVRKNLVNSFPDKTEKEISQVMKNFYKNLTDIGVEIVRIQGMRKEEMKRRMHMTNFDLLHSYLDKGMSTIVLTSHQCNWEWLLLGSSVVSRYVIEGVYKPLHNATMDKWFHDMRSQFGARPLAMKDVYRSLIKNKNETRIIALVADQTPAGGEIQHFTKFLNQNTPFFVGADKIAKHTGYVVIFLETKRIRRGYYEATFHLVQEPPFAGKGFEVIDQYAHMLEESIRKNPSDWLWSHKRWKHTEMVNRRREVEEESSKEEK